MLRAFPDITTCFPVDYSSLRFISQVVVFPGFISEFSFQSFVSVASCMSCSLLDFMLPLMTPRSRIKDSWTLSWTYVIVCFRGFALSSSPRCGFIFLMRSLGRPALGSLITAFHRLHMGFWLRGSDSLAQGISRSCLCCTPLLSWFRPSIESECYKFPSTVFLDRSHVLSRTKDWWIIINVCNIEHIDSPSLWESASIFFNG